MSSSPNPQKARVFEPFARVFTPRTPDSSYDSFGGVEPPPPAVMVPLITEGMTSETVFESGIYLDAFPQRSRNEGGTHGVTLQFAAYSTLPWSQYGYYGYS